MLQKVLQDFILHIYSLWTVDEDQTTFYQYWTKKSQVIAKASPIHFYQLFGCKFWVQQSKHGHPDLDLPNHLLQGHGTIPKPTEKCTVLAVSWVCPKMSSQWAMNQTPHLWSILVRCLHHLNGLLWLWRSSWSLLLLWPANKWPSSSPYL